MRKSILIYSAIAIFLLVISILTDSIYIESVNIIQFNLLNHSFFDLIVAVISFLIFIKANKIGSITHDRRMVIIAAGFLANSIFTLYHAISSNVFTYDTAFPQNINLQASFSVYLAHRWLYIVPILVAPLVKPYYPNNIGEFRFKLYSVALGIVIFLAILDSLIINFLHLYPLSNVVIAYINTSLGFTEILMYILAIFIYTDNLSNKHSGIHPMILGLIILAIAHFDYSYTAVTHLQSIVNHIFRIAGFSLVLIGVQEVTEIKTSYLYSFRQKNALFYSVFYSLALLFWVLASSLLATFYFPGSYLLISTIFGIIGIYMIYRISQILSAPISNINKNIDNLMPAAIESDNASLDISQLKVISNDELGEITQKINNLVIAHYYEIHKLNQTIVYSQFPEEIASITRENKNIDENLQKIADAIGKNLNSDKVMIMLTENGKNNNPENFERIIEFSRDSSISSYKNNYKITPFLKEFNQLIKNKNILIINDISRNVFSKEIDDFYKISDIKSNISISLKHEDVYFGILSVNMIDSTRNWTETEIGLVSQIANIISVYLYQNHIKKELEIKTFQKNQIRRILDIIRENPDIDNVLESLCLEIGMLFGLDRVSISKYEPDNERKICVKAQYSLSEDIPDITQIELSSETVNYFTRNIKNKKAIIIDNIKESDLPEKTKQELENVGTKSVIFLPIQKGEEFWGFVALSQIRHNRTWKEEEISLAQSITCEFYSAITISQLYTNLHTKTYQEESLHIIINALGTNLDLNSALNVICREIQKIFKVDRVSIAKYSFEEYGDYFEWSILTDYKASPDIPGFVDSDFSSLTKAFLGRKLLQENQDIVISNMNDPDVPDFYREEQSRIGTKSILNVPISKDNEKWGILGISQTTDYRQWTKNEISLLHNITDYIFIAIRHAELFSCLKAKIDREDLIKRVIETIRSTLDINDTLRIICDEVAKLFNVERATIVELPNKENYLDWIVRREYKVNESIKGLDDCSYDKRSVDYWAKNLLDYDTNLAIDNISESDIPEYFKDSYKSLGVKSIIGVPIKKGNDKWGIIVLSEYNNYRHWTDEEINLIRIIAGQIYMAIKQAELFSISEKQAKREASLRNIISIIRNTLDINEIKEALVTEAGKFLNADRAFIIGYNPDKNEFTNIDKYSEYLSSSDEKSLQGIDYGSEELKFMLDINKAKQEIIFENSNQYIEKNNLKNTPEEKYIKTFDIKSNIGIPILYTDKLLGIFVVHYTKDFEKLSSDIIDFVRTLANQTGIALYQSRLYSTVKETAEREKLLRQIIQATRNILDIKQIQQIASQEIGKVVNADLCFIIPYNNSDDRFEPVIAEYKSYSTAYSLIKQVDITNSLADFYRQELFEEKRIVSIKNINDVDFSENLKNKLNELNIRSLLGIPVTYHNIPLAMLFVCQNQYQREWKKEDIDLISTIASQLGIAIYQTQTYERLKTFLYNEKTLREIIGDTKVSLSQKEVFDYILFKVAQIFNVENSFFIETPPSKYERPEIKYEYIKSESAKSFKNIALPEICYKLFSKFINEFNPFIISNIGDYCNENADIQNFFKENNVKSIISVPFIRYNHTVNILGALILCSQEIKSWSRDEIALLKSIADYTVTVLWEITKRSEIESLRNTFMLTLAHDLQVPLVGERRALEFLISRPDEQSIGKFKEMISDILQSNENLSGLLCRLLDSYNYESGRQILHLSRYPISDILNEVLDSLQNQAKSKSILINLNIQDNLPELNLDKCEIKKVFHNLLENAITYTQEGGHIIIDCHQKENNILTCINDNGPGILPDVRERLFERYAMAQAIERKIGSGLGLYLSKQIIEAHNGEIYYTTKIGEGTTFCVILPFEV